MRIPLSVSTPARAVLAALMLVSSAAAQTPAPQKSAPAQQPAAKETAQRVPVPPAERLVLLIRMSLLTLNDALQTGNYSVLRDRGSPAFRATNSAAKLARIFTKLEAQNIDLAVVAVMMPQLTEANIEGPEQRLRIKGFFPGQPTQINFEVMYEPVDGHWQLFGISVAPTPAQAAAAQPPAAAATPAAAKKAEPSKAEPKKK